MLPLKADGAMPDGAAPTEIINRQDGDRQRAAVGGPHPP
jgi:hypothetical protein